MKSRLTILVICGLTFFLQQLTPLQAQRFDTLYYNAEWKICEKPFASYYRFGKIVIDTIWFYQGRVRDFYLDNQLEMDGQYSNTGQKDGVFTFFYPDGTLKAKGAYAANLKTGTWEYFYEDGKLMCIAIFDLDGVHFSMQEFRDANGKVLLKDGTGKFEMRLGLEGVPIDYRTAGEFKGGKRSGTWMYYFFNLILQKEELSIKETFENGELKKGAKFAYYNSGPLDTYKKEIRVYTIKDHPKFKPTESFYKDKTSFRHNDDDQDLLEYLVSRKPPDFDADAESFEKSYFNVLRTLNTSNVLKIFTDPNKDYSGKILFNLSDSGDIEEVEIVGNISEKEKEQLTFFLKKFKNIHDIVIENVSIDAYHTIYFYTVTFADIIPQDLLYSFPKRKIYFSIIPYDKLVDAMRESQKKKRKEKKPN